MLSDAAAAEHVRHAGEIRPDNATANHPVPTGQQLADFRSASKEPYTSSVSGNFVGSTDEIIQWAAWKWGVDEDVIPRWRSWSRTGARTPWATAASPSG